MKICKRMPVGWPKCGSDPPNEGHLAKEEAIQHINVPATKHGPGVDLTRLLKL